MGRKIIKLSSIKIVFMNILNIPAILKNGNYMPPLDHRYSIEMKRESVNKYLFPKGEYWSKLNYHEACKIKNIVVTAAAQGIGKATAVAFANEGANVIALDINEEKLNELKREKNEIQIQKLDATNQQDVEKFANTVETIDVLFHAVGFVHHGTIMKLFFRGIS